MYDEIENFLDNSEIYYETNVSLKDKTWIKRGGITTFWIQPKEIDHLKLVVRFFNLNKIRFEIVGHTSNLYFKNEYDPIAVISTISLNKFKEDNGVIACECGANTKKVANYAVSNGYAGFEGLVDLPGTVGSAIHNNSGCFKCLVSDLMLKIDYLKSNGEIIQLYYEDMLFGKRQSILKNKTEEYLGGVILTVYLKVIKSEEPESILITAETNHKNRFVYQDKPFMNLGSVYYKLPWRFLPKLFIGVVVVLSVIFGLKRLSSEKLKRNVLVYFFGAYKINKYISKLTVNRFFFIDEDADNAFTIYQHFIERIAKEPKLEIEIKNC